MGGSWKFPDGRISQDVCRAGNLCNICEKPNPCYAALHSAKRGLLQSFSMPHFNFNENNWMLCLSLKYIYAHEHISSAPAREVRMQKEVHEIITIPYLYHTPSSRNVGMLHFIFINNPV